MKSKIKKSVIPFGAIIATALLILVTVFSLTLSKITFADNGKGHNTGKMLTIYDRGTEKVIVTQQETIGTALAEAGIAVDSKDVVEPAMTEKLIASDYQVNIYRARPVLVVDGNDRVKVTTAYQTAEQIIQSAGIKLYDEDKTTIESTSDVVADGVGLQVMIDRAMPVNLTLYGRTTEVRTHATTVGGMLHEKGVEISSDDQVTPSLDTKLTDSLTIRVWREGRQIISIDEPVAFSVDTIEDADRAVDYNEIKVAGEDGLRSVSYEITIVDGVEVSRTEIASIMIKPPKTQTELVGIKGQYTTPTENESITWDYLIQQGFTKIQTAGIMGNLKQENKFYTDGDGIAQWTGSRRDSLYAKSNPNNIYTQLDFLMEELNGSRSWIRDKIKSANQLTEVVQIFQDDFEVCNPSYCMQDQRVSYARDILASH